MKNIKAAQHKRETRDPSMRRGGRSPLRQPPEARRRSASDILKDRVRPGRRDAEENRLKELQRRRAVAPADLKHARPCRQQRHTLQHPHPLSTHVFDPLVTKPGSPRNSRFRTRRSPFRAAPPPAAPSVDARASASNRPCRPCANRTAPVSFPPRRREPRTRRREDRQDGPTN